MTIAANTGPVCAASKAESKLDANVRYTVADISTLPMVADEVSPSLNDAGQVSLWFNSPDETIQSFVWDKGHMHMIGALKGDASSISHDINNHGDVVGWSVNGKNLVDSLVATRGFFYSHGQVHDVGTLGGRDSQAFGINDAGQVVGVSNVSRISKHAFLYKNGKLTDLGTLPGGTYSAAVSINNSGVIAGTADNGTLQEHAVIWDKKLKMTDLGTLPGGKRSRSLTVNDKGDVVGFSEVDRGEIHGFIYSHGRMTDVGELKDSPTRADGINDHGQVVGVSGINEYVRHAYIWQNGKMEDLNPLVAQDLGWRLIEAYAINNKGQILCTGERTDLRWHLLLLDPVK